MISRRNFFKHSAVAAAAAFVCPGKVFHDERKGLRLSTIKGDPGFSEDIFGYEVFLDGKPVKGCHTADENTGECFVFDTEEEYKKIPGTRLVMGGIPTKILKGGVRIVHTYKR